MSESRARAMLDSLEQLERLRDPAKSRGLRQFERFVVRAEAELHPNEPTALDRQPIEIRLRDIGIGGVGFVCTTPLDPRTQWQLVLTSHGFCIGAQPLTVRHRRLVQDGAYLVGGQFCGSTGLLLLAGVDPNAAANPHTDKDAPDASQFVAPGDV